MVWPVVKRMIHNTFLRFVANVNLNSDGRLKANVNRFSNDNVWNAENRNRVVVPKLTISPPLKAEEFSFVARFSKLIIADSLLLILRSTLNISRS